MSVRWILKSLKPPQYREPFRQRFGFVGHHQGIDIWFHAVSVGETSGAISIIKSLLLDNPSLKIIVTTTTPTGAKLLFDELGGKVTHYYSPCDLPGTIKRFIKRIAPKVVVIMETELWPNWLNYLYNQSIPVILANARLSKNSAKKYGWFPKTSQFLFSRLSKVLAVDRADALRFESIGVKSQKIEISGNIKFDAEFPEIVSNDYYPLWSRDFFIWIAASTHGGEDAQVIDAHKLLLKSNPEAKLILVPRHPERFESVAEIIQDSGLSFSRRSDPDTWSESSRVVLGDTMGELLLGYQISTVAFIGGSFVDTGGHNAIEAAYYSKPIITGPIYHNFQYLFDALAYKNAAKVVGNHKELAQTLIALENNPEEIKSMGKKAKLFIDENKGALKKVVTVIQRALKE